MGEESRSVIIKTLGKGKEKNIISIPGDFISIGNPLPTKVKVSLFKENVHCKKNNTYRYLKMSPSLLSKLGLKEDMRCYISLEGRVLRIGPVIGILVREETYRKLSEEQNVRKRIKELVDANRQANAILYFFSKDQVHFKQHKVNGVYFDDNAEKKLWKTHFFPLPEVLYDRGGGRRCQQKSEITFREQLAEHMPVQKINAQSYFDKWDLYQTLRQQPAMKKHLPTTLLFRRAKLIRPADIKHLGKVIYVKQCISSNGYKIMRIERHSTQKYTCSYMDHTLQQKTFQNVKQVIKYIEKVYGKRKLIIQEGIELPVLNKRMVDMRATVQRNRYGHLEITGTAVRIGEKKSPVTSTRTGSNVLKLGKFYRKHYKYSRKEIKQLRQSIHQFLFKVYHHIEKAYGPFGEMGIDFGIDKAGNIKLIECNSKPAKSTLSKFKNQTIMRDAYRNPIDYGIYLAGF